MGALSPLIVGGVTEVVNKKAAHSADDDDQSNSTLDPTYPLLAMVAGSYLLCSCGFALNSYWILRHNQRLRYLLGVSQHPSDDVKDALPIGKFHYLIQPDERDAFLRRPQQVDEESISLTVEGLGQEDYEGEHLLH